MFFQCNKRIPAPFGQISFCTYYSCIHYSYIFYFISSVFRIPFRDTLFKAFPYISSYFCKIKFFTC